MDKRRCSNNEDDGKGKGGRRQDRESVETDSRRNHGYGCKARRFPINTHLSETATGRNAACRPFPCRRIYRALGYAACGFTTAEPGRASDARSARGRANPIIRIPWIERGLIVWMMARIGDPSHNSSCARTFSAFTSSPVNDRVILPFSMM